MGEIVGPVGGTGQEFAVHWTDSRRGLVVIGSRPEIAQVARDIGLADEEIVAISAGKWAIALWDEQARKFADRYNHRAGRRRPETDKLVSELVSF